MIQRISAPIIFIIIMGMLISIPFSTQEGGNSFHDTTGSNFTSLERSISPRAVSEEYFFDNFIDTDSISSKENISVTGGQAQLQDNFMVPGEHSAGLWHFDNGTWNTAYDSSGHGNDGTIYGGMIAGGLFHGSLALDGVNDYVGVPYTDKFNFGTASFGITGWFKSPGPYPGGSISVRVIERNDDAEEYAMNSAGRMDLDSSDLELVDNSGKGLQHVGMRFQNVEIPNGAT